jgi:hypothetical protein
MRLSKAEKNLIVFSTLLLAAAYIGLGRLGWVPGSPWGAMALIVIVGVSLSVIFR